MVLEGLRQLSHSVDDRDLWRFLSMTKITDYPTEAEFLEISGSKPEISQPNDGFWQYKFVDNDNVVLELSFDIFEGSVQTILSFNNRELQINSYEGIGVLRIEKIKGSYAIVGQLQTKGTKTKLTISLNPVIQVKWSSLVTESLLE